MLSRFCKLCHGKVDIAAVNLRRYRVTPTVLQKYDDEENIFPPEEKFPKFESSTNDRIPIITARDKSLNFYKGMAYKKFEIIPIASRGWRHSKSAGDHFTIHPLPEVEPGLQNSPGKSASFQDFDLHPQLIENLKERGIYKPSEIQIEAIPKIAEGNHTILSAETGCGKTLAFLLPVFNHILKLKTFKAYQERGMNRPFAIIVTPSLELSLQITAEANALKKDLDIDIKLLRSTRARAKMLNPSIRNVDLLIGTFGIMSKMITNKIYKLEHVKNVVLDEAHALFHETFDEKLEVFLKRITFHSGVLNNDPSAPAGSQLTLVSATKPSEMPEYLHRILDIQSIENITTNNFHRVMVPQKFIKVAKPDRPMMLLKLVKPRVMKNQRIIIFCNDSSTTDWMSLYLNEFNIRTIELNGEMPLHVRKGRFMLFQNGQYNVLATTNSGARGLDAHDVNTVINYDFPIDTADYIHRCGRTGRLGSQVEGRVISLISSLPDVALTQKIERAARRMAAIPMLNIMEEHSKRAIQQEINFLHNKRPRKFSKGEKRNDHWTPKSRKASV